MGKYYVIWKAILGQKRIWLHNAVSIWRRFKFHQGNLTLFAHSKVSLFRVILPYSYLTCHNSGVRTTNLSNWSRINNLAQWWIKLFLHSKCLKLQVTRLLQAREYKGSTFQLTLEVGRIDRSNYDIPSMNSLICTQGCNLAVDEVKMKMIGDYVKSQFWQESLCDFFPSSLVWKSYPSPTLMEGCKLPSGIVKVHTS